MDRIDSCVLCRAPARGTAPGIGGYRVCRVCDVAWRALEDPPDLAEGWDRHYYADSQVLEMHQRRISGLESIARRITGISPGRGRLLDVGAGIGIFMEAAARLGWSVEGVEPSVIAAQLARERTQAPVYQGLLENLEAPEAAYDAVLAFDTLRHVPDPMAFLLRARRLLRPGGILVIREVHRGLVTGRARIRSLLGKAAGPPGNRAYDYRQCFSPKSFLFAYQAVGLTGIWVEPSPVFAESDDKPSLSASLLKRSLGLVSRSAYRLSGRRIVLGPNLLAIGKAPSP